MLAPANVVTSSHEACTSPSLSRKGTNSEVISEGPRDARTIFRRDPLGWLVTCRVPHLARTLEDSALDESDYP